MKLMIRKTEGVVYGIPVALENNGQCFWISFGYGIIFKTELAYAQSLIPYDENLVHRVYEKELKELKEFIKEQFYKELLEI